ncbi:MAG: McrC family protein [Spirochaetaceae bacterium]
MRKNNKLIEAKDCLAFDVQWNDILWEFSKSNQYISVFNLEPTKADKEPLISFNYQDKKWYAGRYIGSISFKNKNIEETINIKPRFGDPILFKMFEELFNIKFSKGSSSLDTESNSYYLKMLISFIWLQKLTNANRHGLPQVKKQIKHISYTLKGRLLVKPTLREIYNNGKIVTSNKEKELDKTVINILHQAHTILKHNYQLGMLNIPDNAMEAIHQFDTNYGKLKKVSFHEYKSIKYHPMYHKFKDVVDYSWQIINSDKGFNIMGQNKHISGFFLDMAEIWENYVRSFIKRHFLLYGWHLVDSDFLLYPDRFYHRKIIPDIVLKKGDNYCVFDAKYKKMEYRDGFTDLDRDDFFQIHTYISYLQQKGKVILGGLIYPVTTNTIDESKILPKKLFDNSGGTHFFADGPIVKEHEIQIDGFLKRISKFII